MNTYQKLVLNNGKEVKLTLNFARLLKVKNNNTEMYEKCNKVMMNGAKDIFDMLSVIYTSYLCANLQDEVIKYEEFIELVPFNLKSIAVLTDSLMTSKKK